MKAAIEYLKQNALNIACFFGLSGAALFALLGEGASMAAEYPVPSIALALAALCIGACVGNAVAKRRANKELQAERERLEAEIKSAKASCEKRLAAAQAAYGQAVEELRAESDQALAELQADYDALTSKRAAKLDKLARTFSCMPESSKKLVAEALDNGELIVAANSSTRTNRAVTLAEKGILWFTQPIGESFPLYVREDVITEIREHRSEWLGM